MYKKCKIKIILLSTNEKAKIGDLVFNSKQNRIDINKNPQIEAINKNGQFGVWVSQYLYILSDEEIKENDWIINGNIKEFNHKLIHIVNQEMADAFNKIAKILNLQITKDFVICKKIIASTNSSLGIKLTKIPVMKGIGLTNQYGIKTPLPSLPQSFIEEYISEYNKGNKIEEVMVEYEDIIHPDLGKVDEVLQINPNNTINIKRVKDSWTKDEVCSIMQQYMEYCKWKEYITPMKWIENNL